MSSISRQSERIASVDPSTMNQEIQMPIDLMRKYKEDPSMWPWAAFGADLGCGDGRKTARMFAELDMGGFAFDVNPRFVQQASKNVLMAFQGDVTEPLFMDKMTIKNHMAEWYGTVNMGGLLVNVPGNRRGVFEATDRLLTHGGHVFITEVMRCDQPNIVLEREMGGVNYANFQSAWRTRYQNNEAMGLPYGTVVIAKPGNARILEWGSPADLLKIISTGDSVGGTFERLVEHQHIGELISDLRDQLGYEVVETRYGTVSSRVKGQRYPLMTIVARKPDTFRYRTKYVGMNRFEAINRK